MSKGSDINVGSIEEAIKRCDELIKVKHSQWIGITNQNAIKTVLDNLEALCDMQRSADKEIENAKKINEEHQKINRELREKVIELEEINKELMNEYHKRVQEKIDLSQELEETISKQKIKDKIKEYEELVGDFEKTDNSGRFKRQNSIDFYKLEAFKELLQESEDK